MVNYFKKGVKGSIIILVFSILANLAGYAVRAFLARVFSVEQFGLFYAVFTFFMFVSIFTTLGYSSALVKFIPQFRAEKKKEAEDSTFSHVLITILALSVLSALILAFFADYLTVNYFRNSLAKNVLYIFCVFLVLNNIVGYIQESFRALQDMFKSGLVYFLYKFLFFIFAVVLFYLGFSKTAVLPSIAFLMSVLVVIFLFGWSLYKKVRPAKFWHRFDKKLFSNLTSFALPTLFTQIGSLVIGYIDTILITFFLSLEIVGVYNTVLPTVLIVGYASVAITTVLFPLVSELWAKKEELRLKNAIPSIYTYATLITLPFVLSMLVYPGLILSILFGSKYVSGALAMRILAIGVVFIGLAGINFSVLSGIGKPKEVTRITLIAAVLNAVLNILIIPILGMEGAALTTTLSYLFMLVCSYFRVRSFIKFKVPYYMFFKLFLMSLFFMAALYGFKQILHFNIYIDAITGLAVSFILYAILAIKFKVMDFNLLKNTIRSFTK